MYKNTVVNMAGKVVKHFEGWADLWLKPIKWDALYLLGLFKYAAFTLFKPEKLHITPFPLLCVHRWTARAGG